MIEGAVAEVTAAARTKNGAFNHRGSGGMLCFVVEFNYHEKLTTRRVYFNPTGMSTVEIEYRRRARDQSRERRIPSTSKRPA